MADLGTMKQDLYRTLHLDANVTGTMAVTDVTKAIIEAIKYNKNQRFWSNERTHTVILQSDQYRYPLPSDFVGLAGSVFYAATGDSNARRPLRQRTVDWCESYRVRGDVWDTSVNAGNPDFYSVDDSTKELLLIPIPSSENDVVDFKYIVDMGIPSFKYVSDAWEFYQPQSTVALTDAFTNGWFTELYYLTFHRAAHTLLATIYGGTEESTAKSQEHLKFWADELNKLRTDAAKLQSAHIVTRHL